MRKIGIYGGTFDPIHHGHLILARQTCEELGLDQLIFVPAALSPFKKVACASGEARLSMLQAAIEGDVIEMAGVDKFDDYFVNDLATSEPQIREIANELENRSPHNHNMHGNAIDDLPHSQWIVIDYLEVVMPIHPRDELAYFCL